VGKKDKSLRNLGLRIAEARGREGLTRAQLGEMVGVNGVDPMIPDKMVGRRWWAI